MVASSGGLESCEAGIFDDGCVKHADDEFNNCAVHLGFVDVRKIICVFHDDIFHV